jgi:hypothetical protein
MWAVIAVTHLAFANLYCKIEQNRLQTVASAAAYAGARLLPARPYAARGTAHTYATLNGIPAADIVLIEVARDQRSLTVELTYRIPIGFALFHCNSDRNLTVTARADLPPLCLKHSKRFSLASNLIRQSLSLLAKSN